MLIKLYETLNASNDIKLNFKRQNFQHYKGFIGRGNNAPLLFQLFKASRWWWNLYATAQYDENGTIINPVHGSKSTKDSDHQEDFKEHNFIFTQWKKMYHFRVLQKIEVNKPKEESKEEQPRS